jgi:hypothetical protein
MQKCPRFQALSEIQPLASCRPKGSAELGKAARCGRTERALFKDNGVRELAFPDSFFPSFAPRIL